MEELHDLLGIFVEVVSYPGREDNGQARAVCDIVDGTQFMLDHMSSPVFRSAGAEDIVVCDCSRPHNLGSCIVILRVFHNAFGIFNNAFHGALTQMVGEIHVPLLSKIAFHDMGHHIGDAGCCLIFWQCECQFRIEDGKTGPEQTASGPPLDLFIAGFASVHVGDNRCGTCFAAGCRQCEDGCERHGIFYHTLVVIEIPYIPFIRDTGRYGLCRVDNASPADGENEVNALVAAAFDALVNQAQSRIRFDTAEFHIFNTRVFQRFDNRVIETGPLYTASPVMEEDLFG